MLHRAGECTEHITICPMHVQRPLGGHLCLDRVEHPVLSNLLLQGFKVFLDLLPGALC